jgi:hypothetical protein
MIEYALKNEIIESGVIFLKTYSNGSYWILKDQSWTFFNHHFEMDFIVIPNEHVFKIYILALFIWTLQDFVTWFPIGIHHNKWH